MRSTPSVAVIIPVHNKIELTLQFLKSFKAVTYPNYRLIVVDDGSTDGTADIIQIRFPHVTVLQGNGNLWWSGATNLGVRYALDNRFDYVLTINNDTQVSPDFLTHLATTAEANPRTLVGSRIHFMDRPTKVWAVGGQLEWHRGVVLQLRGHKLDAREVLSWGPGPWPVAALTGCGTLIPSSCYREIGMYDTERFPHYHGDSEFTLRAATHGYRILVDVNALVWNDARNTSPLKRGLRYFFSRRSPRYWRPIVSIHLKYCPRQYLLSSMWRQYTWSRCWMRLAGLLFLGTTLAVMRCSAWFSDAKTTPTANPCEC